MLHAETPAEMPLGSLDDAMFEDSDGECFPASPSKSARRRTRRKRQATAIRLAADEAAWQAQVGHGVGTLARADISMTESTHLSHSCVTASMPMARVLQDRDNIICHPPPMEPSRVVMSTIPCNGAVVRGDASSRSPQSVGASSMGLSMPTAVFSAAPVCSAARLSMCSAISAPQAAVVTPMTSLMGVVAEGCLRSVASTPAPKCNRLVATPVVQKDEPLSRQLDLLLGNFVPSSSDDLVAKLRAAAPEVYED